ncbi:MAG TPA: hypothetical protein VGM76_00165 [Lacipirellulaceae bacterium]|jgi:hypothetical protein
MTAVPKTTASADRDLEISPQIYGSADLPEPNRPVLRFGLRHLFWFVTGVSVLLATLANFPDGSYNSLALVIAIAVVVLHLMGAAIGCHLRAEADRHTAVFQPLDGGELDPSCSMQLSPLHVHGLALRRLPLLVAIGAILGGCLGAVLLEVMIGGRTTSLGVAVGALSTAVLGGWFTFLAVSFSAILRQGWRDAVAGQKLDEIPRVSSR